MSADPAAVVRRVGLDAGKLRLLARCAEQPVYDIPVLADEWSPAWSSLRGLAPETGLWPVILGSYVSTEYEYEDCVFDDPKQELLEAPSFDLDGWLEEQRLEASELDDPPRGNWPTEAFVNNLLTVPWFAETDPAGRLFAGLVSLLPALAGRGVLAPGDRVARPGGTYQPLPSMVRKVGRDDRQPFLQHHRNGRWPAAADSGGGSNSGDGAVLLRARHAPRSTSRTRRPGLLGPGGPCRVSDGEPELVAVVGLMGFYGMREAPRRSPCVLTPE